MSAPNGTIYKISCINNGYFLYGSTNNFNIRKGEHIRKLKNNQHCNKILQDCFNKYGENSIIIENIQSNIPIDILLDVENIWIGIMCSKIEDKRNGINIREARRPTWSLESREKLSNTILDQKRKIPNRINFFNGRDKYLDKIKKNIIQTDLEGNIIEEFISIRDAERKLNIPESSIRNILKRNSKNPRIGYKFYYK